MKQYRMTDEEMERLLDASKPVPYLVMGGIEPASPYDRAMHVWDSIADRVGCVRRSMQPASTGDDKDFMATKTTPNPNPHRGSDI